MQPPMECREPPHRSKTHSGVAFLERLKDILEKVSEYNSHYRLEKDKFDTFLFTCKLLSGYHIFSKKLAEFLNPFLRQSRF